jgi:metallophosphoesterase (TIGR00282 family)
MRILFFGDIMGRSGREGLARHLPTLRTQYNADAIIANGENAAGGYGITMKLTEELFSLGVNCITTGNHIWGQKELVMTIGNEPRLLRPMNYPDGTPGRGVYVHTLGDNRKLVIANIMGRVFMDPIVDDPFVTAEKLVTQHKIGNGTSILLDIHAETGSEKMAISHVLNGRVSAVVGTHTHIPTADAQILQKGTAYQTDIGMCGDYDSVIGMKKELAIWKFTHKIPGERLSPAEGEATVCGAFIETDDKTGLAITIIPIRLGGRLG